MKEKTAEAGVRKCIGFTGNTLYRSKFETIVVYLV